MSGTSPRTNPASEPGNPEEQSHAALADNTLHIDDGDARNDDNDSAYNDNASDGSVSYKTSLASSILNYRYENGRRYHAYRDGTYLLPNDDEEQERMDLVHHVYTRTLGGELHLAPIDTKSPQRVLDLGTGTGIWAIDFADAYESAEVIGNDLSPIQPEWIPPNCVFEVDDYESNWPYSTPFNYIHGRELEGCIGDADRLIGQAFQHLAPGGFLELQATYTQFCSDDGTSAKAENALLWLENLVSGLARFGKPIDLAIEWKQKLEAAGFVDVRQEIRKLPIGTWPKDPDLKETGRFQVVQQIKAVESYTSKVFADILGWSKEETEVLIAKVRKDLTDPSIHLYIPLYFVWGRKP